MKLKDCKTGMSVNTQSGSGIILPDREDYITYEWTLEFNQLKRIPIPRKAVGICLRSGTTIFTLPEKITPYRHGPEPHSYRLGDISVNMNITMNTGICHDYRRIELLDMRTERH